MTENRRTLIANLKTILEAVSGVVTVVRHYSTDLDITQYSESELPLIGIKEPVESPEAELVSMRAMMWLEIKLKIYFITWGVSPTSTYETLMKNIRDKIGADPNLNSGSVFTYVRGISEIGGTMPLFFFEIDLASRYYLNQKAT